MLCACSHTIKLNEALADKIGGLMISDYNDAKRLTLSANSWPSRVVAGQKAAKFHYNAADSAECNETFELQYVTSANHPLLMKCIVDAHSSDVFDKMSSARAISQRLDGSVDRTQIDKIYVLCKIVSKIGDADEVYIGVAEPEERGASGMVKALKSALRHTFGDNGPDLVNQVSSIVTDGASRSMGIAADRTF